MKKKFNIRIVLCLSLIFFLISSVSALDLCEDENIDQGFRNQTIKIDISIESYDIKKTVDDHEIYISNYGRLSKPGQPCLPSRIFSIAIPPGTEFVDIVYQTDKIVNLPGQYYISPVKIPEISNGKNTSSISNKEYKKMYEENINLIYNNDELFPAKTVEFVKTSGYRKYNLVDVRITPFKYNPVLGSLEYYPEIKLHVSYKDQEKQKNILNNNIKNVEKVGREIIINYDQAQNWYNTVYSKQGLYDFVIITIDTLTEAVQPLVQWEIQKGRTVQVVTTSWIESEYNGYDLSEKIRNFLREKYPSNEWGIEDVLIVGHYDDIPLREVWQWVQGGEKAETDFYYAELSLPDNESWDADGDHQYGENSDPVDFYAEVNVGRIPWSDYETVRHICEKSVNFEMNNDPSFKNSILLLAAFVDDRTDGATYTEYIANNTINPWMAHWMKTRLYQFGSDYPMDYILSHQNVISVWSQGKFSMVAWHAHGSPHGSGDFISVNDCPLLNDNYPAIISAASCSNSDTDYLNIGQAMMRQGAVGFLGANKVAFYSSGWSNPNDGSDQSFKYFFTSRIASGEYTQGQALQYAVREMYVRDLWFNLRYESFIHSSLWGNPDLDINSHNMNNAPSKPERPNGPNTGKLRTDYTFTSSSIDPENDQVYYCWSWGDDNTEWIGPFSSGEEISASHSWNEEGNYVVKVKSKDIYGSESEWSDSLVVNMPKNKIIFRSPQLLYKLIENHPYFISVLRQILDL